MAEEGEPQNDWKRTLKPWEVLGGLAIAVLGVWFMATHSGNNDSDSPPPPPATPGAYSPEPAPRPAHNYVYVGDDGQYGYQQELSSNDQQAGVAQKPLVMVRYLGEKNGSYRAIADMGGGATVLVTCKEPCAYMEVLTYSYGTPVDKSVIPTSGTLGGGILADAMAGRLQVYGARKAPGG